MGRFIESEWIAPPVKDGNYIMDGSLAVSSGKILITYQKASGARKVRIVTHYFGRVVNKIDGRIVAWCPVPEPYDGPEGK